MSVKADDDTVLKVFKTIISLNKKIVTLQNVKATMKKLDVWFSSLSGDEREENNDMLQANIIENLKNNPDINELNVLLIRDSLAEIKDARDKPIFNLFDNITMMFIFLEHDGMNQLEVDMDFYKSTFQRLMLEDTNEIFDEHCEECYERLQKCLHLAKIAIG